MYSWVAFPLLRITILFTIGIVAAVEFPLQERWVSLVILGVLFTIYLILFLVFGRKKFFSLNGLFGIVSHALVIVAGYVTLLYHNDQYDTEHILYEEDIQAYQAEVIGEPEEKERSVRYLVHVEFIKDSIGDWQERIGKLYLYIRKDSATTPFTYGDQLLVKGSPNPTSPPKNPNEFDYKRYLSFQNIYHQDFASIDKVTLVREHSGFSMMKLAIKARQRLRSIIDQYISEDRERAIALALILGAKDELTGEINDAYSAAGAMHVLAVSGLHVGIIYVLMLRLFKDAEKRKYRKWVFLVVTLSGLWAYAMITGLSASVLRAVTMFSFLTIAKVANRESSIYNTLAAAGLILLCFNPYMVMSVGFQLSFMAVFGIVYMTPKFEKLIYVKNKILRWAWTITCVSIAAQVATAPLTLLYFHQFPTYFFLSNLVVIPAATGILYGGILLFVTSLIPLVGDVVGFLLDGLIYLTNEVVFWVDSLPYNTISNIYIDISQSWLIIMSIVLYFLWRYARQFQFFVLTSLSLIALFGVHHYRSWTNNTTTDLTIYNINGYTAIDVFDQGKLYSRIDSSLLVNSSKMRFHIRPNRLLHGVSGKERTINSLTTYGDNELLVHNGLKIGVIRDLKEIEEIVLDIAVVADQRYIDEKQLKILSSRADHLIIDGSNSSWSVDRVDLPDSMNISVLDQLGAYNIRL